LIFECSITKISEDEHLLTSKTDIPLPLIPLIAKRGVLGGLVMVLAHSSAIESGREVNNNIFNYFSHTKTQILIK
jgi:hypothetical protein